MIYRKHPIRSLLHRCLERQAFGNPRMYPLSPSKSNKRATENSLLKFLTVSSVSGDSIVNRIIDDIINTAVKTAEVDEQKTKYLQHFIIKHDTIVSN
jgi:hypothetical protein